MKNKNLNERIIIALDYDNLDSARKLLKILGGEAVYFKIGFELFTAEGKAAVHEIKNTGSRVFLDLKFHDIPNTVYKSVRAAGLIGADMVNVHASGGYEMMTAAKRGAEEAFSVTGKPMEVIAVTVLTSLSDDDVKSIYCNDFKENISAGELALKLAKSAKDAGLDGVVCSGHESGAIKNEIGSTFITVVPGVRLGTKNAGNMYGNNKVDGDQKRVITPGVAFKQGADYIVVGREITGAADPLKAFNDIKEDIKSVRY